MSGPNSAWASVDLSVVASGWASAADARRTRSSSRCNLASGIGTPSTSAAESGTGGGGGGGGLQAAAIAQAAIATPGSPDRGQQRDDRTGSLAFAAFKGGCYLPEMRGAAGGWFGAIPVKPGGASFDETLPSSDSSILTLPLSRSFLTNSS